MQVLVNGLITNYERTGRGKCILMLHGWGDNLQTFDPLLKSLETHYEILRLDLPGFGQTSSPKTTWGLQDYAAFVAEFLKKIDAKNPYALIGFSNGGAIAIKSLASNLVMAEKLVLLSSAGMRGEYKGRMKALRLIVKTGKLLTRPFPKKAKKILRKAVYKTVGSDMLVAEKLQETFKKVVGEDIQADIPLVKADCLLIYGQNDTATPPRFGTRFKQLFVKASLVVIPNAGHFLLLDNPRRVQELVLEFIAK